jgi:MSHA biogenesis protein MshJ
MNILGYVDKFEAFSLRERALVVVSFVAILGFSLQTLLLEPMLAEKASTERQLRNAQQLNATLLVSLATTVGSGQIDTLKSQIASGHAAVEDTNRRLSELSAGLITAPQMVEMLRSVLASSALGLVSMENLVAEAIVIDDGAASPMTASAALFKHRLVIELRGSYFDVVAYLQGLEQQPRGFLWDSLQYDAKAYPRGVMRLEVYTLSLEQQWLGYQ